MNLYLDIYDSQAAFTSFHILDIDAVEYQTMRMLLFAIFASSFAAVLSSPMGSAIDVFEERQTGPAASPCAVGQLLCCSSVVVRHSLFSERYTF